MDRRKSNRLVYFHKNTLFHGRLSGTAANHGEERTALKLDKENTMPLTSTGKKILNNMIKKYGDKKGQAVFYSSINKKAPGSKSWHESKPIGKSKYTEALA